MNPLLDQSILKESLKNGTGKGVRIALLDTGVEESHEELKGLVACSYELTQVGRHFTCSKTDGIDSVGHGSACASIIKKLAPDAELHSIKVFGSNTRLGAEALAYAIKWSIQNNIDLVNASLGTVEQQSRRVLSDIADEAFYNGTTIVAAANNMGMTAYPANLSSVLAVDSESFKDPLSFFYRLETPIELQSNGILVEAPNPKGGTKYYTGTSFACPHVTGIIARILSIHPKLQPFEIRTVLWNLGH